MQSKEWPKATTDSLALSTTVKVIDVPDLKVTFVLSLVSSASNLLENIETVGMIWISARREAAHILINDFRLQKDSI